MKKNSTQQASRRFHSKQQRATNGMNTFLRIFLLILLCGSISTGTGAWSQTRSASTESTRSTSRTPKTSEAKTEKKASSTRAEKKATETRTERKESESRTEKKAIETRSSETRTKSETSNTQQATNRQEPTRSQMPDERRESVRQPADRQGREADGRNGGTRGADLRDGGSRETLSTRMSSGYRLVPGSRNPERVKIQLPDIRFRHNQERCTLCFGVGFIYTNDRLHRIRCSHCYGRGFAVEFIARLDDVCPICYNPVSGYGQLHRRTIQNTASYVMERLDHLLYLSRSQERAIKRIVLDYLRESRYDGWYDPVVVRDREIMRELSNRQQDIYVDFMNNLDSRDLCDRCFDYF